MYIAHFDRQRSRFRLGVLPLAETVRISFRFSSPADVILWLLVCYYFTTLCLFILLSVETICYIIVMYTS